MNKNVTFQSEPKKTPSVIVGLFSLREKAPTKKTAFGGEKQNNKKSSDEQSDLGDLEKVTLKSQLQADHCLTL